MGDVKEDIIKDLREYDNGNYEIYYTELNNLITEDEVVKAIKSLKANKSPGPDLVINEFFINACDVLKTKLTLLFNFVFNNGHFLKQWVDGLLIPIHKKGSKSNIDNYRGVTLLSSLGKLFTRILNNRLSFCAETYGVLIELFHS